MAALDFLFEGKPPPTINTTTVSATSMPPWYQDYQRAILSKANAIGSEDYQTYQGPRVADFSDNQQQAFSDIKNNQGNWSPLMGAAVNAAAPAASGFDPAQMQQFMNPYQGAVVDEIGRLGDERWNNTIMPGVMDTFTGSGQFGSQRNQKFVGDAAAQNQREVLGQQSQALNTGYNSAASAYQNWANLGLQGSSALGQLAKQGQSMQLTDAAALEGVGSEQQGMEQKNLDMAYQDFQNERDYPKTQLDWINNILKGSNVPTSTQTTGQSVPPYMQASPLSNIAGMASAGQSIWNTYQNNQNGGYTSPQYNPANTGGQQWQP